MLKGEKKKNEKVKNATGNVIETKETLNKDNLVTYNSENDCFSSILIR